MKKLLLIVLCLGLVGCATVDPYLNLGYYTNPGSGGYAKKVFKLTCGRCKKPFMVSRWWIDNSPVIQCPTCHRSFKRKEVLAYLEKEASEAQQRTTRFLQALGAGLSAMGQSASMRTTQQSYQPVQYNTYPTLQPIHQQQGSQTYSGTDYIRKGGLDRDTDNDGMWDYGKGGLDRDADNDGMWDYGKGGLDRDTDSDGAWDYGKGGLDRDTDNDGMWDYGSGGLDRDLDNDGMWDYGRGGLDRDMDNDGSWDY